MRNSKTLNIAVLQTAELALDSAKLGYLLEQAKNRGSRLAVLPEYVCNLFFKELERMPPEFVAEQGERQFAYLAKLAKMFGMTIVAPLVRFARGKPFKSVYRFAPDRVWKYDQTILIGYPHWNEAAYFANSSAAYKPAIFRHEGFRIGVIAGFELHFDALWHKMIASGIDAAIAPSIGTFESFARWQTLCKSRAFTGGCYLIRANRIGESKEGGENWDFYGNSLVCNPFGEIENSLDDREGILTAAIDGELLHDARKAFGFAKIAKGLEKRFAEVV